MKKKKEYVMIILLNTLKRLNNQCMISLGNDDG